MSISERMEIGDAEGLKNYIDDEWLLASYPFISLSFSLFINIAGNLAF